MLKCFYMEDIDREVGSDAHELFIETIVATPSRLRD